MNWLRAFEPTVAEVLVVNKGQSTVIYNAKDSGCGRYGFCGTFSVEKAFKAKEIYRLRSKSELRD